MRCAVLGCSANNVSKEYRENPFRFYTFPKDEIVRERWIFACGRADKFKANTARICSRHFSENDFVRNLQHELLNYTTRRGPKLKPGATPNLCLPVNKTVIENGESPEIISTNVEEYLRRAKGFVGTRKDTIQIISNRRLVKYHEHF